MGGVISLYKPTTTLQPKVLGFVWCTLSHRLFPKAMYIYCTEIVYIAIMHGDQKSLMTKTAAVVTMQTLHELNIMNCSVFMP